MPSALTYTVKKAEEQLDIKLFDRNGQRARLTPAGQLLLEEGREVLARLHGLEEQLKRVDTGWETQCRIVVDTILPVEPLYPLIRELQAEHAWLNIQILEESLSGSWEALINQRADLVIGMSEDISGLQWDKALLGQVSMGLYCGANHPAAALSPPIDLATLDGFTHIVVNDSARHIQQRNVGLLGLKQVISVPSLQHKIKALVANMGISHLPHYVAKALVASGELQPLVYDRPSHQESLLMVWPKNGTGKANDCLRQMIIERDIYASVFN